MEEAVLVLIQERNPPTGDENAEPAPQRLLRIGAMLARNLPLDSSQARRELIQGLREVPTAAAETIRQKRFLAGYCLASTEWE